MMQVTEPDYELKIGIKDGKVISLDWGTEFLSHEKVATRKEIKKRLKFYYKEAIKFIKDMKD
jgi:hypothetical protein